MISIFKKNDKNIYREVKIIEKVDDIYKIEEVKENSTDNFNKEKVSEAKVEPAYTDDKINIELSTLDEYITFIIQKNQQGVRLSNISSQIWNKFNRYAISKYSKDRIKEYEEILYEVIDNIQNYHQEKKSLWFEEDSNIKFKIHNDISFAIRYSENLIRIKHGNKRILSYDKLTNIDELRKYLDIKFETVINKRINDISLNIPDSLFELDVDDIQLKENTFDIDSLNKNDAKKVECSITDRKENEILKIDDDLFISNKELDRIIKEIDDFEI